MLDVLKKIALLAIGFLVIALFAWLVFPSSQKAADSIAENNVTKKRTLGEIIVRDFLGIPKCGLLGGGCSDRFSDGQATSTSNARFSNKDIRLVEPTSGSSVRSGLQIEGLARGTWFSQGIASGEVRNEREEKIGAFTIRASGATNSTAFVSFLGTITYGDPATKTGYLVFNKANPTGDAKKNSVLWVPVRFEETSSGSGILTPPGQRECKKTGCSGQICSDVDVMTTCEYRAEYTCFQAARCERQISGECGFTQTTELQSCLSSARNNSSSGI